MIRSSSDISGQSPLTLGWTLVERGIAGQFGHLFPSLNRPPLAPYGEAAALDRKFTYTSTPLPHRSASLEISLQTSPTAAVITAIVDNSTTYESDVRFDTFPETYRFQW